MSKKLTTRSMIFLVVSVILVISLTFIIVVKIANQSDQRENVKNSNSVPAAVPNTTRTEKTIDLVCEDSPLYNFSQNGQVVGIAADIVTESFSKAGYRVKITVYPWARAFSMVQNGEADAII